jgi:uncharacterized protein YrzB (UPF0473 family)
MKIKADEIILLFDPATDKNVCFHVVGVIGIKDWSKEGVEDMFVLLLPELKQDELDTEAPLLLLRFLTDEDMFEFIEDQDEFNRLCDHILPVLEKPSTEKPMYINGEKVINTFEL